MVARIRNGKNLKGAINYNESKAKKGKAELILAHGYPKQTGELTFHEKLNRLQKLADLNTRAETNCLHVSLNFDVSEQHLTSLKLNEIGRAYMEGIGFGNQPFLVYKHDDAAHPHIHIVSTNIQKDGKRISLHNLGKLQSEKTRKEIEVKFGLVKASERQQKKSAPLKPIKLEKALYGRQETKRAISNIVTQVIAQYKFASLPELNAVLTQYNVIADKGAEGTRMNKMGGLQYSILNEKGNKVGVPIKASSIYDSPTLINLATKFQAKEKQKEAHKDFAKKFIASVMHDSTTRNAFVTRLQSSGVDVILRRNDQGFIYGVTYIDHKSKCVFNGNDLGKEFSAAMIREKWGEQGGGSGTVAEKKIRPDNTEKANANQSKETDNSIIEELTGNASGFQSQLPYPYRRKKLKQRKM